MDGEPWDLFRELPPRDGVLPVRLVGFGDAAGREMFWHSSAHVLGCAVERVVGAELLDGPVTDAGFYYDCVVREGKGVGEEALRRVALEVRRIVGERARFQRLQVDREWAARIIGDSRYKLRLLERIPEGQPITVGAH